MVESSFASKRRVFIVDDDAAFAAFLTNLVGTLGHEAIVKTDARSSDTYEIRDSDIVFLDMVMPYVNGLQVLEQLGRQNVKSAIVLMSGNDQFLDAAEIMVKKLDLQLLGVLHKPFRLEDVRTVLNTV